MGIFLSVLVASVGAMDVINCLAYVSNQLTAPPPVDVDLERYRRLLKEQIDSVPMSSVEGLTYAQDGVAYKDGYRVEKFDDARLDQLNVKLRDLEQKSQEKDQKLDRLNVQLQQLERKSAEREAVIGELRSRSVSRAVTPEPSTSRVSNSANDVPQILLDDNDSRQGSSKFRPIHREDEFRQTRKKRSVSSHVSEDRTEEIAALTQMEEDEANKMEDYVPLVYNREDLQVPGAKRHLISPIQELCQKHEDDDRHRYMERSPEPTSGADTTKPWGDINLEETKEKVMIRLARTLSIEEEARDSDSSVLEDSDTLAVSVKDTNHWPQSKHNTFLEVPQPNLVPTVEPTQSNLSSKSNSPDTDHPTLKRTRKKSDLTALLLEEERKSDEFSGMDMQTEESNFESGRRTQFMQCKSPSPYVGAFLDHERLQTDSQLIPLVADRQKSSTPDHFVFEKQPDSMLDVPSRGATISPALGSSNDQPKPPSPDIEPLCVSRTFQPLTTSLPSVPSRDATTSPASIGSLGFPIDRPKSPTPNQEPRSISQEYQQSTTSIPGLSSRDATISPAPIGSSGSPASPVSSIVDEFVKDGSYQTGGEHLASSPVQSERNVSRDGSVSLASTDASAASLDLHVDPAPQPPTSPPPPPSPIQHKATAADLDADGVVDRKSSPSSIVADSSSSSKLATQPPRRFRTRKRMVRSVTPIDFNQTFMDQFTDQRMSVSPSELEEYIDSMDEIKIPPPKPVTPNYFLPTTPMTSGVPSLLLTDEKGAEARYHDSLSSKSFYGNDKVEPVRVINHHVSYVEWMKKFPENMTSHLELEDYDSDDEEVENIINGSNLESKNTGAGKAMSPEPQAGGLFPANAPFSVTPSPEPLKDLPVSPEVLPKQPPELRSSFPLNVEPTYATPSPTSEISDISLSSASMLDSSSMVLGSPLLNSVPSPTSHFTPITSPLSSLKSPTPDPNSLSPHPLPKLFIASRSPTSSPIPPDMTPEEMVFEIGHLDGLIFGTPSRSPTPSLQFTPSLQVTPLSPEELAYDIGNLGGLILGPPSRSASPLPSSPSPTPGSSLSPSSSPWTSLQPPSTADSRSSSSDSARDTTTHANTNNT